MPLIYGKHAVEAALKNSLRFSKTVYIRETFKDQSWLEHTIAQSHQKKKPQVKTLTKIAFDQLVGSQSVHQGIALEADAIRHIDAETFLKNQKDKTSLKLMILDQVTDPQNLGSIIRSATSFGFDALFVCAQNSVSLDSPVLYKIASGAAEILPLIEVQNLKRFIEQLKENHIWVFGLDEMGTGLLQDTDLAGRTALVLGAEGPGLRRLTKESCDQLIKLNTSTQFSTLNVAATAAIVCYELSRQQDIS